MPTLITGVTGQDGSYLAELLSRQRSQLVGVVSPHLEVPPYVSHLQQQGKLDLLSCDLADTSAFRHLLRSVRPKRVFHLAAISTPREAADDAETSQRINVASVEALTDWVHRDAPGARVLLMSSAAIYGRASTPQSEATPAQPVDEYGRQKLLVREIAEDARRRGHFAACAIPFNHESPRRDERFVFAKVCHSVARIARGEQEQLMLGNLDAQRDWGYAPEYCAALAAMLDAREPLELVLATGEGHTVRELVQAAFARAEIKEWQEHVAADFMLLRPADFNLVGDASLAETVIGWQAYTHFDRLVGLMLDAALKAGRDSINPQSSLPYL